MTVAVLDASALLALLLAETGAEKVRAVLAESSMTTINLAEVVGYYARNGAAEAAIRDMLASAPISHVPPDEELAYDIGLLQPTTAAAGLSLGDRACLALGRRLAVPVLTSDRSWAGVAAAVGVTVEFIR